MFNETKSKPIQHENCVGWAWKCWLKNLFAIKFWSKTIFLQSTWFIPFLLFLLSGIPIQQLIQHGIFVMLDEMLDRFNKALRPYSHLTLCLTLNFIFGYCSKACSDLKITVNIFYWFMLVTWPWRHGWRILLTKLIKFGADGKRILCQSIFAIEPIAGFCPLGYEFVCVFYWMYLWICFSRKTHHIMYN